MIENIIMKNPKAKTLAWSCLGILIVVLQSAIAIFCVLNHRLEGYLLTLVGDIDMSLLWSLHLSSFQVEVDEVGVVAIEGHAADASRLYHVDVDVSTQVAAVLGGGGHLHDTGGEGFQDTTLIHSGDGLQVVGRCTTHDGVAVHFQSLVSIPHDTLGLSADFHLGHLARQFGVPVHTVVLAVRFHALDFSRRHDLVDDVGSDICLP